MKSHRSRSESRTDSRAHRSHHHSQSKPGSHTLSPPSPSSPPPPSASVEQQATIDDITITSGNFNDDDDDDDQETSDVELRHDEQLEKDISTMSKLKDSSGMAHALLEDLRLQEKLISRQLPLDPWKASRSPSAAVEPPQRCRFDSPKFASPSRRVHTHSSSTTNPDDSLAGLSASIATTPAGGKRVTLPRYQQQGTFHCPCSTKTIVRTTNEQTLGIIKYDFVRQTPGLITREFSMPLLMHDDMHSSPPPFSQIDCAYDETVKDMNSNDPFACPSSATAWLWSVTIAESSNITNVSRHAEKL